MDTAKRPLKVFLCHSSNDKPAVRELYEKLIASGVDAWLDEKKLLAGQQWDIEIQKAVREADAVIVCLSKTSITKEGYVQKEIKFSLDIALEKPEGTIYLIPAKLEECKVPSSLCKYHWVDLFNKNGYLNILNSLRVRASQLPFVNVIPKEPDSAFFREKSQNISSEKDSLFRTFAQKKEPDGAFFREKSQNINSEKSIEIALWGPTHSGKDWLFRSFARELDYYNRAYPDFSFDLSEKGFGQPRPDLVDSYDMLPSGVEGTIAPEDHAFIFRRIGKINDDVHKISSHVHHVNIHNTRGGDLLGMLLNQRRFEEAFVPLINSRYVLILLDPDFSANSTGFRTPPATTPFSFVERDSDFLGAIPSLEETAPEIQHSLEDYPEDALRPALNKTQYHYYLRMLFRLLAENNNPKRYLAVCITKMDTRQLAGNHEKLLEVVFGQEIANLVKSQQNTFHIKIFDTSAAGYCVNSKGQRVPNISNGKIISASHWKPVNCAAPFFWIFENQELENIREKSNFFTRESNLRKYIGYPVRR